MGREKRQQETWHSFKSTSSHLPIKRQKPHNALKSNSSISQRSWPELHSCDTWLPPSLFILTAAWCWQESSRGIKGNQTRAAQLKLLICRGSSFVQRAPAHVLQMGGRLQAKPHQMQNSVPLLFCHTWAQFEMLMQLFRCDLYDQQVLRRCKHHNDLSSFMLLQVYETSGKFCINYND